MALSPPRFCVSQACFASLVSQDYVNGTDQEEIRTGEARAGLARGGSLAPLRCCGYRRSPGYTRVYSAGLKC